MLFIIDNLSTISPEDNLWSKEKGTLTNYTWSLSPAEAADRRSIAWSRACRGSTVPGRLVALPSARPPPDGKESAAVVVLVVVGCSCSCDCCCCCCVSPPNQDRSPSPRDEVSWSVLQGLTPVASLEMTHPSRLAKLANSVSSQTLHREWLTLNWSKYPCLYRKKKQIKLGTWINILMPRNKEKIT